MADLLGFAGLTLVACFTLLCSLRWPSLAAPFLAAFLLRALAALVNIYVVPLPDSTTDAISFEHHAWEWAQGGVGEAVSHFTGPSSYFISWLLSVLYALTDRSLLLAQSVSLLFGIATVVLGARLAQALWGQRAAVKAVWLLAIFPSLVLYSALVMREAYIWFFVMVALYGVALWMKEDRLRYFGWALFGFAGATFFHGAMVLGALIFLLYVALRAIRRSLLALRRMRVHPLSIFLFAGLLSLLFAYGISDFSLPKIGNVRDLSFEQVIHAVKSRTRGSGGEAGAAFPSWTTPNNALEVFTTAPLRMAYFTFSPFPWDVRKPAHLIGMFDGLFYLLLFYVLWQNRRAVWANRAARAVLFIILSYILIFSFGAGNFGAGLRHRAKFIAGLIVLTSPFLPMFIFKPKFFANKYLKLRKSQDPRV